LVQQRRRPAGRRTAGDARPVWPARRRPGAGRRAMIDVAANLAAVRARIARAAERARRDPAAVRLIAVSKTMPAALVRAAIDAGATDVGENYVQEAVEKRAAVGDGARWHLIGHLQRNKAARAVETFDCIQTVDSAGLAAAIA